MTLYCDRRRCSVFGVETIPTMMRFATSASGSSPALGTQGVRAESLRPPPSGAPRLYRGLRPYWPSLLIV